MTQHGDAHGHDAHGHDEHGHDEHGQPPAPPPPARKTPPGAVLIGFLVLLVGELLILSQSGISIPRIMPEVITEHGPSILNLFYVILAITGFFFLLTETLLLYFVMKYRAQPGGKARHTHGNHTLELVWTFIPGMILFGLALYQTRTWAEVKFRDNMPKEEKAAVVQVFARQFNWYFRYPGEDRKFGTADDVTSRDTLYLPVGTDVLLRMRTRDVLHSFWLPNGYIKQDILPGQVIPCWFKLTKTGTYEVVCAELCGSGHTNMRGVLQAVTPEEYAAWQRKKLEQDGPHDPKSDDHWQHWRD